MIPYIKPSIYSIDALIGDLNKILKICEVQYLSIVGGEPFTNKNLIDLIRFVNQCDDIPKAKIITNGTIFPTDDMIHELLKKDKIEVHIDQYPGCELRSEKIFEYYQKKKVRCELYHYNIYEEARWKGLGENHIKRLRLSGAMTSHRYCAMNKVYTLSDGLFVSCPRGITTEMVYGQKRLPYEYIVMDELMDEMDGKARIAVCIFGIYKEYCRYCYGVTRDNPRNVIPGLQLDLKRREK